MWKAGLMMKDILKNEGFHGKQVSNKCLYTKRKDGGRGLRSFIDIYKETKVRVACYVTTSTK